MKQRHLSAKVKGLRNQKGLSQEILADESGLSLRTIQRIENGETNPTGDTLIRLAHALNVTPDELMDWAIKEDNAYLIFLNLSALSFIFFPILGILVPFIMWTSKKDKIKNVYKIGIDLINFEISWTILLFFIPFLLFLLSKTGLFVTLSFSTIIAVLIGIYAINIIAITFNTFRINSKKDVVYFSFIRFLK